MKARRLAIFLNEELIEFNGYLEDTKENIEAPMEQLNPTSKGINTYLKEMGIDNQDKIMKFGEFLSAFKSIVTQQ